MGVRDPGDILNFCVGVKDPGRSPKIYVRVKETRGEIQNFCEGVRDPWRNPKFL